ncbi:ComE operon protein 1 [bacterium HR37]|nr:ComE operon protein 1 [bacterium HR37]
MKRLKSIITFSFVLMLISSAGFTTETSSKVNINKATIQELTQLPGIGESTAKNIVAYREKVGGFKTIDELKNVKGIGEKKFERIKDLITTEDKPKEKQNP